ncbi:MAG: type II secretion system protein [Planctomycetota bacterium]
MRSHKGFTLVELLVVIGIIALLVSILLPTLTRARESSQALKCLSNLRQIGVGLNLYVNDFDNMLPFGFYRELGAPVGEATSWNRSIRNAFGNEGLSLDETADASQDGFGMFLCPSATYPDGFNHYSANPHFLTDANQNDALPIKMTQFGNSSEAAIVFDASQRTWGETDGIAWQMNQRGPEDDPTNPNSVYVEYPRGQALWDDDFFFRNINIGYNSDMSGGNIWPFGGNNGRANWRWRHGDLKANFLFADGHAVTSGPNGLRVLNFARQR